VFWSSQTKSLNFLKCLVLVSIFENLQKYDLLFSLFLGGGGCFLYLSSSFMKAEKTEASQSPKKRETLKASFSRRMVVHERCANKACGAFVSVFSSFPLVVSLFLSFSSFGYWNESILTFLLKRRHPRSERDADVAERLGRSRQ